MLSANTHPSDPAVRDQAASARPGVPSGVLLSRFPAPLGSRTPPTGAVGITAAAPVTLRVRRAVAGDADLVPDDSLGDVRRPSWSAVGPSAAHDPFQHGQDALRGTLDDPDVPDPLGPSSRRVPGHARGVADGSREAAVARRVGWSGPFRAAGVTLAVTWGVAADRTGSDRVGSYCGRSPQPAVSRPAC